MRVTVLGTGIMGAGMTRNLAEAGHEVRAWDRTRAKAEGLGAEVADSPAEAVRGAEVVVTMLARGEIVRQVMEDAAARHRQGVRPRRGRRPRRGGHGRHLPRPGQFLKRARM